MSEKDQLGGFTKAVGQYVEKYTDTPRAKDFKRLADEQAAWQMALAWNQVADALSDKPLALRVKDVKDPKGPLAACRAFLESHPKSPDADTIAQYVKYLEAIQQRDESDTNSAATEIRKTFALVYVKDVYYLKLKDGRIYYGKRDFSDSFKKALTFLDCKCIAGFDGAPARPKRPIMTENVDRYGRAPQSLLADKVSYLPENFADKTWEDTTLDLVKDIQRNKEIDPFLKLHLLKRTAPAAARGSMPLKQAMAAFLEGLEKADIDQTLPWMDPDNEGATKARPQAQEAVDKLPSLATAMNSCDEEKKRLETALLRAHRVPVGFLYREKGDQWQCYALGAIPDGELFVLVPGKDQSPDWKLVGAVRKGKATIETKEAESLLEGRPVFTIRERGR
jgi:hypothetical protein